MKKSSATNTRCPRTLAHRPAAPTRSTVKGRPTRPPSQTSLRSPGYQPREYRAKFGTKTPASRIWHHPNSWEENRKSSESAGVWVHEWVQAVHRRVFRSETRPDGPMLPLDATAVKGLTVYGMKCGETKFFGTWIERSGVFIGWTRKLRKDIEVQLLSASKSKFTKSFDAVRIQPHIAGIESDYAVGEVLGRPVFVGITLDLSGHDAVDKFTQALKEAAWDLGVA